ncbi:hypothetical protein [Enterococcus sp. AZ126]|uniref:hypothetical protein n=1 Tax=Enterococcus sp. AZ126 TaxID=2774635 RepID=UPI003F29C619
MNNKLNEIDSVISQITKGNNKSNILPLICFSTPLFFITTQLDDVFFCYVLQNRALTDGNNSADIKELYISKTTFDLALEMLDRKISIYEALNKSEEKYRVGQIGRKVFPKKKVFNLTEIANRIPKKNYFLEINNDSIKYAQNVLHSRKNIIDKFDVFEKIIDISDQQRKTEIITKIRKIDNETIEKDYTFIDGVTQ